MIETSTIMGMFGSFVLSFLVPLILMVYLCAFRKFSFKACLLSGTIFIVSQIVVASPILNFLQSFGPMQNTLIGGFMSTCIIGFIDIVSIWCLFHFFSKQKKTRRNAVAFGIGRGVVESIMVTGISSISNISVAMSIMDKSIYEMSEVSQYSIDHMIEIFMTTPSGVYFVAGVQSICNIILYSIVSILILYAILKKDNMIFIKAFLLLMIVRLGSNILIVLSPIMAIVIFTCLSVYGLIFIRKVVSQKTGGL